jgi:hypothetical protein
VGHQGRAVGEQQARGRELLRRGVGQDGVVGGKARERDELLGQGGRVLSRATTAAAASSAARPVPQASDTATPVTPGGQPALWVTLRAP